MLLQSYSEVIPSTPGLIVTRAMLTRLCVSVKPGHHVHLMVGQACKLDLSRPWNFCLGAEYWPLTNAYYPPHFKPFYGKALFPLDVNGIRSVFWIALVSDLSKKLQVNRNGWSFYGMWICSSSESQDKAELVIKSAPRKLEVDWFCCVAAENRTLRKEPVLAQNDCVLYSAKTIFFSRHQISNWFFPNAKTSCVSMRFDKKACFDLILAWPTCVYILVFHENTYICTYVLNAQRISCEPSTNVVLG